jgi:hypothetical protein
MEATCYSELSADFLGTISVMSQKMKHFMVEIIRKYYACTHSSKQLYIYVCVYVCVCSCIYSSNYLRDRI